MQTNTSFSPEKKWHVGLTVRRLPLAFVSHAAVEMSFKERAAEGVFQAKDDQGPEPGYRHGYGAPAASHFSQNTAERVVVCGSLSSYREHDCAAYLRACRHRVGLSL